MRRFLAAIALSFLFLAPSFGQPDDAGLPAPRGAGTRNALAPRKVANGNVIVYRRVSTWELNKVLRLRKLFITDRAGEKFVSTSREYVDQLGARHPKDYEHLLEIELAPDAYEKLMAAGAKATSSVLDRAFPDMPSMTKDRPDAVHFKSELGVLNFGFRIESIEVLNGLIRDIRGIKEPPPPVAPPSKVRPRIFDGPLTFEELATLTVPELVIHAKRTLRRNDVPGTRGELVALLSDKKLDEVEAKLPELDRLRAATPVAPVVADKDKDRDTRGIVDVIRDRTRDRVRIDR